MFIHEGNAGKKMKEMAETDNARSQSKLARKQTELTEANLKDLKRIKCQSTVTMWIAIGLLILKGIEVLTQL